MSYITLNGRWCDITALMCISQLRIKMMTQRIAFTRS
jgi:hypothetical protein